MHVLNACTRCAMYWLCQGAMPQTKRLPELGIFMYVSRHLTSQKMCQEEVLAWPKIT